MSPECTLWPISEAKCSVCISASARSSCMLSLISQPRERPVSCTRQLQWDPYLLRLKKTVGRRNRVLFPSHALCMPSSSPTHSSDSTGLGWNFDSKVRMVENPDIKECTLSISPPKALCHNVQSGTILSVGSPVLKLLPSYRL